MIKELKNKSIYLAPKNNFTIYFNDKLKESNIIIKGYLDNFKKDDDIIFKTSFDNNDTVIIFSPNHWQEISSGINLENIYILNLVKENFVLENVNSFTEYSTIPKFDFNKLSVQKYHWNDHLESFSNQNSNIEEYGYSWGDPLNPQDDLGNYLSINNKLLNIITSRSNTLEIGTLGGKWTKYMLNSKKVICVDINNYFIDFIKKRFSDNIDKLEFYVSRGNELEGIKSNSIDIIFSMDTLVRVEKEYIFDYIQEIARILISDGKAIIHLPNSDIEDCRSRKFTVLNTNEINIEFLKYFKNFRLDSTTIVHGTLVFINC